jgi:hypothetical protein
MSITDRYNKIVEEIPDYVTLVAAIKTRTAEEIREAIDAGIGIVGGNYVQETGQMLNILGRQVKWHMLGHLQRNKVKQAVQIFDMIQTLDSLRLAKALDSRCANIGKVMPVLVEVNSGRESQKTGIFPEELDELIHSLVDLRNISVQGLMTMGPELGNPEDLRPFLRETKEAFDRIASDRIPGIEMRYLSMGMSDSYAIAIEEGSNMIRLGTKLFGPRRQ